MVVGLTQACRDRPELAGLAGPLATTVPVRADASGDPPFAEFLGRVREAAVDAGAPRDLPLARLAVLPPPGRDGSRSPLFGVALACPEPVAGLEAAGVAFRRERAAAARG